MWLLENLNYFYDSHLWSASILGPQWSRKGSHAVLTITTSNHQLLRTYYARCFKTLFLRITIPLCNKLLPLFLQMRRRLQSISCFKSQSQQCSEQERIHISDSKACSFLYQGTRGTRGIGGERGPSRSKGEPSPSLAGHLAGCVNPLVLQGHRLSQNLEITEQSFISQEQSHSWFHFTQGEAPYTNRRIKERIHRQYSAHFKRKF